VGLGKTIEAGLILSELILQRRIQRILILTPASLREQWQKELLEKFCIQFDVMDRPRTMQLRRRLGLDANPWRSSQHIITSYHYLKQPDVLEDFLAACRVPEGSPHLPWDLLIVDEVHNLAPAAFGEWSGLSRMLRTVAPYFEHKVFATATPHNGRTRSFSGILEILDPARFSQTGELTPAERARIKEVLVRRLKSEINEVTDPPRFARRLEPQALTITLSRPEAVLSARFSNLRDAVQRAMASASWAERSAGAFAVEVLGKRLLSCPHTFADSWRRTLEGLEAGESARTAEVQVSERAVREETGDDREQESRLAHAARVIGAWLKPMALELRPEIEGIGSALADLRLESASSLPVADARYDALKSLIRARLQHSNGSWRNDERLVVFTEFKTTLDYLVARLSQDLPGEGQVLRLFGTGEMDQTERTAVITAFNDPGSPVRILVATDAASEGLNLQASARYLLHFDVPWNPARIEQRNGRVDRYGQASDVTTWHFASDDDADVGFLFYVATKLHFIREDLGSVAEVFDLAVQQRLIENRAESDVRSQMELSLNRARRRAETPRDASVRSVDVTGAEQGRQLAALRRELDLDGGTLRDTFEIAIGAQVGLPRLRADGRAGVFRLIFPVPAAWREVVDDSLRMPAASGRIVGALPALTFDSANCLRTIAGRTIFRPDADMALLHLWHPLLRQSLQFFSRIRFPGTPSSASCWTVSRDPRVPAGVDAWVFLTLEELGVNDLRETMHRWVRTVVLPVTKGRIGKPLPQQPVADYRRLNHTPAGADLEPRAREVWLEVEPDLREFLMDETEALTRLLKEQLTADREAAARFEAERFQSRQGELSQLITETRMERLEREIDALNQERAQGVLFDPEQALARLRASVEDKQTELKRLRQHIEDLRDQLNTERDRVLNLLIPRRFALRGQAQVLPVSVEIRFPEGVR
jgi:superfamily II DNA or RNA helicase